MTEWMMLTMMNALGVVIDHAIRVVMFGVVGIRIGLKSSMDDGGGRIGMDKA